MKENDFSVPRRMSKSAYIIIFFKTIRQFTNLLLLYISVKALSSYKELSVLEMTVVIISILLGCIALSAGIAFIKYYFRKYYVENGELIFKYGFIHHETTSIPLSKVHSMRTKRGLIYRLLDIKGISFDTLASKNTEIELILDDEDWDYLLSQVERQENVLNGEDSDSSHEDSKNQDIDIANNPNDNDKGTCSSGTGESICLNESLNKHAGNDRKKTLNLCNINLIKGALCQNHFNGMFVLLGILGTLYNNIITINETAINSFIDYVDSNTESFSLSVPIVLSIILAIYLTVMVLWIGKVILRYYNMKVIMEKKRLFFESGLITRHSSRFSYDKVCTVYIKRNFMENWLGCCTIMLRQAFNATDLNNECNVQIYGSNSSEDFLDWWLGKEYRSSEQIYAAKSGWGLIGYIIRLDVIIFFAALVTLYYYELYSWITLAVVYMLISIAKGILAVHRSGICLKEDYIEVNTGKFADIHNYFKYSNVEVVRIVYTPFTRFWGRVNLRISTNGTSFSVRSLKEREARDIYEILVYKSTFSNEKN